MGLSITKKEQFILFTLGRLHEALNQKLSKKHLRIAIPKYVFIELVQKANITVKKARALYKNLESLEKKKFIFYENQSLSLTQKGKRAFISISKEHDPYIFLTQVLDRTDLLKYSRKSQTVFEL